MIISKDQVIEEISRLWSNCYLVPSDQQFLTPLEEDFRRLFSKIKIRLTELIGKSYMHKIYECEDLAKAFAGECVILRAMLAAKNQIPVDQFLSWPVGICFGTKFNAWEANHWQLIVRCEEGWRLYDPQTDAIWKPSKVDDNVMFILM